MSAIVHFYTADLRDLFQVIGSADRELLSQIGVHMGLEFRALADDDDEENYFESDEADTEDLNWDYDEIEADTAKEIITKMIMVGLPGDLSEDEAYAVQDFMAAYCQGEDRVQPLDADDIIESCELEDEDMAEAIRRCLNRGVGLDEFEDFLEWIVENDVSQELRTRVQMLCLGRLPESEDPTFPDPEEAYEARFGYLYSNEAAAVCDELDEIAEEASDEIGALPLIMAQLLYYCNTQSIDLLVTIEE
ncbi:MAG: hypothetical protein ACLFUS_00410 [Candidatus Sumerlaeia bacterium]